jgi:hypothetical protein
MKILFFLLVFFGGGTVLANTSVGMTQLELTGQGHSYQQAVNEALLEAIARTQGKSLESEKLLQNIEISQTVDDEQSYYSSQAYADKVIEKTQGRILGFDVLNKNFSDGLWTVTLSVNLPKYRSSASADRQRLVIAPFSMSTSSYNFAGSRIKGSEVSATINNHLSEALVNTRKFSVLEREDLGHISAELALASAENTSPAEISRLGNAITADFVLVGSVLGAHFDVSERTMRTSDKVIKTAAGKLTVQIKLIEVATTQVVYAKSFNAIITDKELRLGVNSTPPTVIASLTRKMIPDLVRTMTDQIYPLTIIAKENDSFILSEGGETIAVGDRFEVFQRTSRQTDPYTKEFIGWAEINCCQLEVTRVTSRLAYAVLVGGEEVLPAKIAPKIFVLKKIKNGKKPVQEHKSIKIQVINDSKNW